MSKATERFQHHMSQVTGMCDVLVDGIDRTFDKVKDGLTDEELVQAESQIALVKSYLANVKAEASVGLT